MPDVIAIAKFRYNKQKYRPGDTVKVKGSHVDILVKAKLVKEVLATDVVTPIYQTRHMEAAGPTVTVKTVSAKTVPELRAECAARGIPVGAGYVPKAELLRLLSENK
jgi:hypothetical protein